MNKISATLLSLCLIGSASLAFATEPMDKNGAMEKDAMSQGAAMKKEPMKKEGAMMKSKPKKMHKKDDKMAPGDKMERGDSMPMEPKK